MHFLDLCRFCPLAGLMELFQSPRMFNTLLAYIASRKDVPKHFAAMAANWFMHPLMRY